MSTVITEWAAVWGIPPTALADLTVRLTLSEHPAAEAGRSEAAVQADIRLAASQRGDLVLWRNNSGALTDDAGRLIRFGLGNDSAAQNRRLKSADLIGIYKKRVVLADVGKWHGLFASVEAKKPGWKHSDASERDRAQAAWAATVAAMGGVALRVTSAQSIRDLEI